MSDDPTVDLTIPGLLQFRDVAMHVVLEACKLVGCVGSSGDGDSSKDNGQSHTLTSNFEFPDDDDEFTVGFVSAFSEIYNNIALHAYEGRGEGTIQLTAIIEAARLTVNLTDTGKSFDIEDVPPLDDPLPMGGMGIHIARTMLDSLVYEPGPPNRWTLVKDKAQSTPEPSAPEDPEDPEDHSSE